MKKIPALFVTVSLAAMILAACGGKAAEQPTTTEAVAAETTAEQETESVDPGMFVGGWQLNDDETVGWATEEAKEAFDKAGLIYGMGHAVYSISDPRAVIFKGFVEKLAIEKGRDKELALYKLVERLAPQIIADERKIYKGVSPNVDFFSGFVYQMLELPEELYTPIFAIARISGWSAHRMEEICSHNKIMRPAYVMRGPHSEYIPMEERK